MTLRVTRGSHLLGCASDCAELDALRPIGIRLEGAVAAGEGFESSKRQGAELGDGPSATAESPVWLDAAQRKPGRVTCERCGRARVLRASDQLRAQHGDGGLGNTIGNPLGRVDARPTINGPCVVPPI